jgi:hypothetical protein
VPVSADDRLLALALALTDGRDVDWAREGVTDDAAFGHLRALESIAKATAASEPREASTLAERRFGPLRLLEKLGAGASGEVFRAWDMRLEREVALKLLRESDGPDSRLVREARLLARVRHPGVVTVYGVETFEGRTGLWTELVPGRTLAALVEERGPFGAREAALTGIEVCAGLTALHAAGLVHGDVKAGNVMRENGGRVVLLDFSAARATPGPEGDVSGTPLYLAPEVLVGEAPPSAASDVYAVGVLLYFLVSGQHPMRVATLDGLRRAHARGGLRRLLDARGDLPPDFVAVVERALAPPGRRYASAAALQAALRGLLAPRRVRWSTVAASAAVVACGGALWLAERPASEAPRPGTAARPAEPAPQPAPATTPPEVTLAPPAPALEDPSPAARADPTPQVVPATPEATPAPEISDADRMRDEGEKAFELSLIGLSDKADAMAAAWRAYREACAGKSAQVMVSEGPSAGRPMLVPMERTAECRGRRADAEGLSAAVRARLEEAEEAARRARVLPGRVRDLKSRYGVDSSFWQE